ncbi:MAG: copper homeostasis protein CutC [Bacteroidales bacterium]|nr:copper homeostasis protein CutC [Bacteroidales bacterium]
MANSYRLLIEVAAFTPNAALAALKAGADRIELCSGYAEGGLSPSAATIMWVREKVAVPLHVMIRPRIGDFVYNEVEKEIMLRDIQFCKSYRIDGVVAGALIEEGDIDQDFTMKIVKAAYPMSVTFHRAFDLCRDLPAALEILIKCGVHRVLTSGGEANCIAGLQTIYGLLKQASGRIIILPGGGINLENVAEIIKLTGISEIHLSGKILVQSKLKKQSNVSFTSTGEVDDYHWFECDPRVISAMAKLDS